MINAKMANELTFANAQKKEEERQAKIVRFINERCEPAVRTSIEDCRFDAFVEVPEGLEDSAARICVMLQIDGYVASIRHGSRPSILIRWDKV